MHKSLFDQWDIEAQRSDHRRQLAALEQERRSRGDRAVAVACIVIVLLIIGGILE